MTQLPSFELVPPGALRDRLNDAVLRGTKTATSRLVIMDEIDGTPAEPVGTVLRLLDSEGGTAAHIRITRTRVLPFDQVGLEVTEAEGEWMSSVAEWRAAHTRHWTRQLASIRAHLSDETWGLTEKTPVVVRFFETIEENQ